MERRLFEKENGEKHYMNNRAEGVLGGGGGERREMEDGDEVWGGVGWVG